MSFPPSAFICSISLSDFAPGSTTALQPVSLSIRYTQFVAKSVTLKIIQNTIAEQKSNLTIEEAITLFKGPLKQYIQEHNGKIPSADDPNPKVRELAAALQMMKNLKERKMRGLDFNPDEFKK